MSKALSWDSEIGGDAHKAQALRRFQEALDSMPAPGGGGFNPNLPKVARLGYSSGLSEVEVEEMIFSHVPNGSRKVRRSEIQRAVSCVYRNPEYKPVNNAPETPAFDAEAFWRSVPRVNDNEDELEHALRGESPVSVNHGAELDSMEIIERFFKPWEFVLVGDTYEREPIPAYCARALARGGALKGPFIAPNPFSGKPAPLADGSGMSRRADSAIAVFRYAVVEFDQVPVCRQLAFWLAEINERRLRPSVIIHSGGKSVHGWVPVKCKDSEEWRANVRHGLFQRALKPIGADPACSNPGRLSRLPGVFRINEDGAVKGTQRIIWIDKEKREEWR